MLNLSYFCFSSGTVDQFLVILLLNFCNSAIESALPSMFSNINFENYLEPCYIINKKKLFVRIFLKARAIDV